jgi:hypothetical protein
MLVLLVISLPAVLVALGIGTFLLPCWAIGYGTGFGLWTLFLIAAVGLRAVSLPGLFARKMSGWQLAFYAQIVDFAGGPLTGRIIGGGCRCAHRVVPPLPDPAALSELNHLVGRSRIT